jgi:hypothetical protein
MTGETLPTKLDHMDDEVGTVSRMSVTSRAWSNEFIINIERRTVGPGWLKLDEFLKYMNPKCKSSLVTALCSCYLTLLRALRLSGMLMYCGRGQAKTRLSHPELNPCLTFVFPGCYLAKVVKGGWSLTEIRSYGLGFHTENPILRSKHVRHD